MGKKYFVFKWEEIRASLGEPVKEVVGYEIIKATDFEQAADACERISRPLHGYIRPYLSQRGYGTLDGAKAYLDQHCYMRVWDAEYDEVVSGAGTIRDISLVRKGDKWNSIEDDTGVEGRMWFDYHGPYANKWGLNGKALGKSRAIVRNEGKYALVDEDDNIIGGWHDNLERVYVDDRTQEVRERAAAKRKKKTLMEKIEHPDTWEEIEQRAEEGKYGYLARVVDNGEAKFMDPYGHIVALAAGKVNQQTK